MSSTVLNMNFSLVASSTNVSMVMISAGSQGRDYMLQKSESSQQKRETVHYLFNGTFLVRHRNRVYHHQALDVASFIKTSLTQSAIVCNQDGG